MLPFLYRGERIRTSDLSVPNRALYQAEPRPAKKNSHCKQPTPIGQNYFSNTPLQIANCANNAFSFDLMVLAS